MRAEDFLQMKPQEVPEPDATRAVVRPQAVGAVADGWLDSAGERQGAQHVGLQPVRQNGSGHLAGLPGCEVALLPAGMASSGRHARPRGGERRHEVQPVQVAGCAAPRVAVRQRCPVPVLTRQDERWQAGEASIRAVLGRVRAYRRWCCPEADGEADGDAEGAGGGAGETVGRASEGQPLRKRRREEVCFVQAGPLPMTLQPCVGHLAVKFGRSLWCLRCFETPGGDFRA
jgi:hypothetical protein